PSTTAPSVSAPPITEASITCPLRMRYIQRPTKSAMGIVQAMVNVPQLLPGMTWTLPLGNVMVTGASAGPGPISPLGTGTRTRNGSGRLLSTAELGYRTVQLGGNTSSVDVSLTGTFSTRVPVGVTITVPTGNFASSPPSAFTTTNASPPRAMITITRIASEATSDADLPNSVLAISASDRPLCRTDAAMTSMS